MLPVIFLMGPTASGKTNLAIDLVRHLNCEIISVDSALIYRGMDIGTAKPTKDEQLIAHHHLIDIIEPTQVWSASDFIEAVIPLINHIHSQQKIPLLVGGTMMYFKALLDGLSEDLPAASPKIRTEYEQQIALEGLESLATRLTSQDPACIGKIDLNNPHRVIRALEVFETTGRSLTQYWDEQVKVSHPWPIIQFGLTHDNRQVLHDRIEQRFQIMLEQGFEQEVRHLKQLPEMHIELTSMRSVGYRQMWQYLDGEFDYETMVEKGKAATRQLAKRQLTWLRGWNELNELDFMEQNLTEKVIHIVKSSCATC